MLLNNSKLLSREAYMKLYKFARNYDHSKNFYEIKNYFGYLENKEEIDEIGLDLQICIKKKSKPNYLHGYIISSALHKYINDNTEIENFNIFETGTARGFSAIVMANIIKKNKVNGKVHTLDILSHNEKTYWNCIRDHDRDAPKSRYQLLEKWNDLRDNYIIFYTGDSNFIISNLNLERIHFAFLDGAHFYKDLINELNFVEKRQLKGDIIVCDDYTIKQFPEICKAIDEFLSRGFYENKKFFTDDDLGNRGYVYMKRII